MRITISTITLAAALSACATHRPPPATADEVAQRTTVSADAFQAAPTYWGPETTSFDIDRGQYKDRVKWRAIARRIKPGDPLSVFLWVDVHHVDRGPRLYATASFIGGETIPAERVSYSPTCVRSDCSHDETYAVLVPSAKVNAGRDLPLRLNSGNGMHIEITLPAHYVAGLMTRAQ
jgi:hypothetical protein